MLFNLSFIQVCILLTVWAGVYSNYAVYSVIAPFFPKVAREKGISGDKFSIVFAAYSFAQMLASYFSGRFLNRIGAKKVVVTGLTVTGLATVVFGCVEGIDDVSIFITVCVLIRFVEGAGFSAFFTSALTIVVETFPGDPGYYVGLTESIVTLGMIMGPPIGSYLYSLGGFSLPLVFFGAVLSGTAFVSTVTIPAVKAKTEKQQEVISNDDYMRVLRLPETQVSIACTALNVATDVFILINLGEHIKEFQLTVVQEGFTYLCLFLSYGLSSPLAGKIADRTDRELLLQSIGCLLLTVSFMMITPVFLPFKSSIGLIVAGLLLKGLGAGPLISCSYTACLKAAKASGRADDSKTYSLVSTIVSLSIPLGNFIGGLSAPILYADFGMKNSSCVFILIFTCLAFIAFSLDKRSSETKTTPFQDIRYEILSSS